MSFKLFTTDPQEKLLLPNWFTILDMIIEKIFSLTFVAEWTSTGYLWNVQLLLLVNISSKLFIIIEYFEIPTFLIDKFSKFSMASISKGFSSSSTITMFSEGLSSSMKPCFLQNKSKKIKQVNVCKRSFIDFVSYLFLSLCQKHFNINKSNKMIG